MGLALRREREFTSESNPEADPPTWRKRRWIRWFAGGLLLLLLVMSWSWSSPSLLPPGTSPCPGGKIQLPNLVYIVPGAEIDLHGEYGVEHGSLDFKG